MKSFLKILPLLLMPLTMHAAETTYRGIKPAVIIDVRTPQEFVAGHIDGALNIPYEQITSGIQTIKGLTKDQPILLYCRSGNRSGIAQRTLQSQGYKQVFNGGGMTTLAPELNGTGKH